MKMFAIHLLIWMTVSVGAANHQANILQSPPRPATTTKTTIDTTTTGCFAETSPTIVHSAGKKAVCAAIRMQVNVTANNTRLQYSSPANQVEATQTILELVEANTTLFDRTNGGDTVVSGSYWIYSKLCVPAAAAAAEPVSATPTVLTLQFLTHGGTLDHTYWDLEAPGYSYVDAAAEAGYATFSYDRLGTGLSDHPDDPIQVVQTAIQVEIVHVLVEMLRKGKIKFSSSSGYKFDKIVGVAHSYGTGITLAAADKYPEDFDALILTGVPAGGMEYFFAAFAALTLTVANKHPSGRFVGLPNGYLTPATVQSTQLPYYRYPYFDPDILQSQFETSQTLTFGELLTSRLALTPPSAFKGPVDIVLGLNDFLCGGNCSSPVDRAALLRTIFFPENAGPQSYLIPDAGHNFAAHYSAPLAFAQMIQFLRSIGI